MTAHGLETGPYGGPWPACIHVKRDLSFSENAMQQIIYSVAQLNRAVQRSICEHVGMRGLVLVRGEIGSLRISGSGNGRPLVFFNLHDGDEALSCVSFGRQLDQVLTCDRQTGEVFSPPRTIEDVFVNERKVICEGMLGTYTRRGQSLFQLSVHSITDCGAGDRLARFRQLREKLQRLGYFASERKRPLPENPTSIALVTSPTGAVIHDFLRTIEDRGLGLRIKLFPVRVQGDDAGPEIASAVQAAGHDPASQVIVLIRGGGSEEDLACFNDECLAKAIFESPVPVLTGIGHEVDMSLADFTADVSASTPTKAAQVLLSPRVEIARGLARTGMDLAKAFAALLARHESALAATEAMLRAVSPRTRWQQGCRDVDDLAARLIQTGTRLLRSQEEELRALTLAAGRALTTRVQLTESELDSLAMRLARRGLFHLDNKSGQLEACRKSLERAGRDFVQAMAASLETTSLQLEAASPLKPLQRGFALIRNEEGRLIRSAGSVQQGETVHLVVADGSIEAVVSQSRLAEQEA